MPGHDCLSMLKALGGFMDLWLKAHALMSPVNPTKRKLCMSSLKFSIDFEVAYGGFVYMR